MTDSEKEWQKVIYEREFDKQNERTDQLVRQLRKLRDEMKYKRGYEDGKRDAMKWISVKERLPEMRQTVVCAVYGTDLIVQEDGETFVDALRRNRKHAHIELGYLAEDGWNEWEGYPMIVSPSYWMPFPDIPMPEVEG